MMTKQAVTYDSSKEVVFVGGRALVCPIDHPDQENVTNTKEVITSRVIRIMTNGEFETLNTIYIPSVCKELFVEYPNAG
jgi:hypothetical protein